MAPRRLTNSVPHQHQEYQQHSGESSRVTLRTPSGEVRVAGLFRRKDAAASAGPASACCLRLRQRGAAPAEGLSEVIRPAAIVPEHAARLVLVELARRDLSNGGEWKSEPQLWSRYDGPAGDGGERGPELMGTDPRLLRDADEVRDHALPGLRHRRRPGRGLDRRLAHRRGAALRRPHPRRVPASDGQPAPAAVHVLTPHPSGPTGTHGDCDRSPGVRRVLETAGGAADNRTGRQPMTQSSSSNRRQRDGPSALPSRA